MNITNYYMDHYVQIELAKFHFVQCKPNIPMNGDVYYDVELNKMFIFISRKWLELSFRQYYKHEVRLMNRFADRLNNGELTRRGYDDFFGGFDFIRERDWNDDDDTPMAYEISEGQV